MGNVNMEASQINYRNNSKKSVRTVETALDDLYTKSGSTAQDIIELTAAMTAKADKIDIAPTFSEETAYYNGDLVFQSGRLWKFTANHEPGEWNQEEVAATNIDLAIKAGGGGSAYSETVLYTGTGESSYTLAEDFDSFDAIVIWFARSNNINIVQTYPVSFLSDLMTNSLKTGAFTDDKYIIFKVTSKTLFTRDSNSDLNIVKIIGVTY